jgi:hypothetical protein
MNSVKQICVALVGTFLLLLLSVHIGLAEGESPPPDAGAAGASVVEKTTQTVDASIDGETRSEADADSTPVLQPTPEPWRSAVNGLHPGYWDASILPVQGVAMYYNPGVFQRVLPFRYEHNHISECGECIGYVALLRGGDIDRRVWLQRRGQMAEGPFWVVDAAAFQHIPGLLSRNWVVDVDYDTAMRWRMSGPIPITVYDADSPEAQAAAAAQTVAAQTVAAQTVAAQTVALVGIIYKCAILPLEASNFQVLDALVGSVTCLTSPQPDPATTPVDADSTNDWIPVGCQIGSHPPRMAFSIDAKSFDFSEKVEALCPNSKGEK